MDVVYKHVNLLSSHFLLIAFISLFKKRKEPRQEKKDCLSIFCVVYFQYIGGT